MIAFMKVARTVLVALLFVVDASAFKFDAVEADSGVADPNVC